MAISISVVIATHDRCDIIGKTIRALLGQHFQKTRYEILIVSDAVDGTNEMVEKIAKKTKRNLRLIKASSRWPDVKRNIGIKNAKGKIVAFTDDDVLPNKNWLAEIEKLFEQDKSLLGVEGKTVADKNMNIFYHATENLNGGLYPACNMAFRKLALEKVGGFDENYNFFREDTDLAFKIMSIGKMVFAENIIVYHPPRKFKPLSILRELKMIKGEIRLYRKFPKLYKNTYGALCKGGIKLAVVSWGFIIGLIWLALLQNYLVAIALIVGMGIFKYVVYLNRKNWAPVEGIEFATITLLRDLLFPFFFVYYSSKINPRVED